MCWGHLPQNGKCGCHFLGVQSKMSKLIQLLMQCFSTLYLHDGDLWCSIIHGCLSKPKCRLPLKRVSQPLVCAAHSPAGMLPGGSTAWTWWELGVATQAHGQAALVPQGHDGILTSLPPPAPAQPLGEVGGKRQPPCISSMSRGRLSARGEVSPGVTKSPLFTSCYQAGLAITFFSSSLTVRS